jgi:hypothetical protein
VVFQSARGRGHRGSAQIAAYVRTLPDTPSLRTPT